jgi:hypothetical protein
MTENIHYTYQFHLRRIIAYGFEKDENHLGVLCYG